MGCTASTDAISIPNSPRDVFKTVMESENLDEELEQLVSSNLDVNMNISHDAMGLCHPIHVAAYAGNLKALRVLIEAGADVSLKDKKGQTALFWAISKSHIDVVEELVEAGSDVNIESTDGMTPLVMAIELSTPTVVEILLQKGADPFNRQELALAVKENKADIVVMLLQAKVDPKGVMVKVENEEVDIWTWAEQNREIEVLTHLGRKPLEMRTMPKDVSLNKENESSDKISASRKESISKIDEEEESFKNEDVKELKEKCDLSDKSKSVSSIDSKSRDDNESLHNIRGSKESPSNNSEITSDQFTTINEARNGTSETLSETKMDTMKLIRDKTAKTREIIRESTGKTPEAISEITLSRESTAKSIKIPEKIDESTAETESSQTNSQASIKELTTKSPESVREQTAKSRESIREQTANSRESIRESPTKSRDTNSAVKNESKLQNDFTSTLENETELASQITDGKIENTKSMIERINSAEKDLKQHKLIEETIISDEFNDKKV